MKSRRTGSRQCERGSRYADQSRLSAVIGRTPLHSKLVVLPPAQEMSHAFLRHNSAVKEQVITLARRLEQHGVRVWLDSWEFKPGDVWEPILVKAMEESAVILACAGIHGKGPWHDRELNRARDLRKAVEYVILPGLKTFHFAAPAQAWNLEGGPWDQLVAQLADKLAAWAPRVPQSMAHSPGRVHFATVILTPDCMHLARTMRTGTSAETERSSKSCLSWTVLGGYGLLAIPVRANHPSRQRGSRRHGSDAPVAEQCGCDRWVRWDHRWPHPWRAWA